MYLLLQQAVEKGEAPIIRVEPPMPEVLPSAEKIVAALDAQSWQFGQFDDPVVKPPWTASSLSALLNSPRAINDNTWVRQKPLVKLADGRYMAPDYRVALNRMTAGVYWILSDALPPNRRNALGSLWGKVVERYVGKLLRYYYPDSPLLAPRLQMNVAYRDGATTGEIDALLDEGDAALVFEIKASPLPVELRASRDMSLLRRWMIERLVESDDARKGVVQLRDAAVAVVNQSVSISPQVKRIYPILVLDDVVFECFGFNRMLAPEMESRLDDHLRAQIQPLTVMSIGELEKALPFIAEGRFGWEDILRSRFDGREVSWVSFSQAAYNHQREQERQGEAVLNNFLKDEFDGFVNRLGDALRAEQKRRDGQAP